MPGIEPGTYYTASENFTSVPHYSILSGCEMIFENTEIQLYSVNVQINKFKNKKYCE